jgi:hypothetical protein
MNTCDEKNTMWRVWAVEQIKDLMSRRAMYSANEERERELDELWVKRPDHQASAAFGRNYGYYVGMDQIRGYYVESHQKKVDALNGMGYMECHAVSSPYVELAEDGMSARGLWYSIGQETYPKPGETPKALWVNDKIAADFLWEEGGWKIYHLVISNDVWHPAGKAMTDMPDKLPKEMDWIREEFGEPTVPMEVHNPLYLWCDNYPTIPPHYKTMNAENSYGPEGHPNYRKEGE